VLNGTRVLQEPTSTRISDRAVAERVADRGGLYPRLRSLVEQLRGGNTRALFLLYPCSLVTILVTNCRFVEGLVFLPFIDFTRQLLKTRLHVTHHQAPISALTTPIAIHNNNRLGTSFRGWRFFRQVSLHGTVTSIASTSIGTVDHRKRAQSSAAIF
jgi:hypothetical protein